MARSSTNLPDATEGRTENATALLDDRVYRIGGQSGVTNATCEWFDLATASWDSGTAMPAARRGLNHQNCTDGTYVYVAGGYLSTTAYATLYRYDPDADTWSTMTSMPATRRNGVFVYHSGKGYYIGGNTAFSGSTSAVVYDYSIAGNSWGSSLASMATGREDFTGVVYEDEIYVFGGVNGGYLSSAEKYDISGDSWSSLAAQPGPMAGSSAMVCDGFIYIVGGINADGRHLQTWRYDPRDDSYLVLGSIAERGHSGSSCEDGHEGWLQVGQTTTSGSSGSAKIVAFYHTGFGDGFADIS